MRGLKNACIWAPRCSARLGACPRLCRNAVANAAAGQTGSFVIATGRQESVRRFIELSVALWDGVACIGRQRSARNSRRADTGEVVMRIDRYFRPAEVETLLGDATGQERGTGHLGSTEEMVSEMINHDREEARKEAYKSQRVQVIERRE